MLACWRINTRMSEGTTAKKRKKVMLYLIPEIHRALKQAAFEDSISMGEVVERLYAQQIRPTWRMPIGATPSFGNPNPHLR